MGEIARLPAAVGPGWNVRSSEMVRRAPGGGSGERGIAPRCPSGPGPSAHAVASDIFGDRAFAFRRLLDLESGPTIRMSCEARRTLSRAGRRVES